VLECDSFWRSGFPPAVNEFEQRATELIDVGRSLHAQGMVPATSGNFSARLSDGHFAITVSGRHKGLLTQNDIMLVDTKGQSLDERRPSAETGLHVQIYNRFAECGAVLHPHSINATLLSRLERNHVLLQDYELLKAFPGIDSHACQVDVPVFANDQNIERLVSRVEAWMSEHPPIFGYLIAGHGFYTWGTTVAQALRHVEAFDFLFACEMRLRGVY
jgi:methylthioribulose-1-phosphate dehydratase